MKTLYLLRVVFLSFELVILILMIGFLCNFSNEAGILISKANFNDEFKKFVILLPVTLFGWILKEAKDLAFLESEFATALVNWPDYKKFKTHIYVSIAYAALFLLLAAVPWVTRYDLLTGAGIILFLGGVTGSFWVAGSIYFAHLSMKEIFMIEHNKE